MAHDIVKPGYNASAPIFKSIKKMLIQLGYQDSFLQTHELGVRLIKELHESYENDKDQNLYNEFYKRNIPHGSNNFSELNYFSGKFYIVQTYNIFELFIRNLISEIKKIFFEDPAAWKTSKVSSRGKSKNIDPFNQLILNSQKNQKEEFEKYPETFLLDYYRVARNSFVHVNEHLQKKANKKHKEVSLKYRNYFREIYELEAPNTPDLMTFSDFILYSRAIKYFSNIINDICFISIEPAIHFLLKDHVRTNNKIRKYKNDKIKLAKAIRNHFHFNFGNNRTKDEHKKEIYYLVENGNFDKYF